MQLYRKYNRQCTKAEHMGVINSEVIEISRVVERTSVIAPALLYYTPFMALLVRNSC